MLETIKEKQQEKKQLPALIIIALILWLPIIWVFAVALSK